VDYKMADGNAMADIRGLDIDKLAKGFADEMLVLKNHVNVSKTSAREIRWFQKTAGFLDSSDSTGITASQIANTGFKSLPVNVEQTWTKTTSYVRKYFVESPFFTIEDLKDTDVDLLATNIRDLVKAVSNQVDTRIYNVLTESLSPSNIQTAAATADGWDDLATGDPIKDLLEAKRLIRTQRYSPEGAVLYIHPTEHKNLLNYLINVKGSSIPQFSSERVKDGMVMSLLGLKVVVSLNATTDYALVFVPKVAATWKQFMPITTAVVDDPGIGKKIRVWEEGECLLTDPKAVVLITDTVV